MDIPWNPAVLEQRIGHIHRLGQHKTVRVINFVSDASIEKRILGLLKFKKSLFAGALDDNGEDVVMVGESQLKKFMQSVESVTTDMEKVDPELERQQQREDEQAKEKPEQVSTPKRTEAATAHGDNGKNLDSLNKLLISGAQFLTDLSKTVSQPTQTEGKPFEKHLNNFIAKDENTGKPYLKIPIPETDVIKNVFSALSELIR